MVAPRRFNSNDVPRNRVNLRQYVNNLSNEEYALYQDWRIENRDNFIQEYGEALNEYHMSINEDSIFNDNTDDEETDVDGSESEEEDSDEEYESGEEEEYESGEEEEVESGEEEGEVESKYPEPEDDFSDDDYDDEYSYYSTDGEDEFSDEEDDYIIAPNLMNSCNYLI